MKILGINRIGVDRIQWFKGKKMPRSEAIRLAREVAERARKKNPGLRASVLIGGYGRGEN